MFLSVMLWFILDSEKAVTFLVDGDRVYSLTEVIKVGGSVVNYDCVEEDDQDDQEERRYSSVSKRMIEQFFTEVEGPDRDWF